jgi:putative endonuclease
MSRVLGQHSEEIACQHLIAAGLTLLARNFFCKLGEIDLIMQEGEQLVFVEVRYRKTASFGQALETVTAMKQKKLSRAAAYYLQQSKKLNTTACRFDVVAITAQLTAKRIEWIKDAFHI